MKVFAPPQTIHVAYCVACGNPCVAEKALFSERRISCAHCPVGADCIKVARYQHAPSVQRSPRKRRKAWKL